MKSTNNFWLAMDNEFILANGVEEIKALGK